MKTKTFCLIIAVVVTGQIPNNTARAAENWGKVAAALEAAKADHAAAIKQAESILDLAIKGIATNQTIDAMKAAIAEKEEFLRTGRAPRSAAMLAAVADYRTARELATKNLIDAYSRAIGAYAKQAEYDRAGTALAELKDFSEAEAAATGIRHEGTPHAKPQPVEVKLSLKSEQINRAPGMGWTLRIDGNIDVDQGVGIDPSNGAMRLRHIKVEKNGDKAYIEITSMIGCSIKEIQFYTDGKPAYRISQGRELIGKDLDR